MLASVAFVLADPACGSYGVKRYASSAFALIFCVLCLPLPTLAQQANKQDADVIPCLSRDSPSGINTSRLSGKGHERWCSLERLVYATDKEGEFLHPTLHRLMEWAETSGHEIYIEFSEVKSNSCTAGSFHIERFDPEGIKHTVVIQLNLEVIDRALVGLAAKRNNGLIPFARLCKEERYAEVLGHELAHAFDILGTFERTLMVEELIEQTNLDFYAFRTVSPGWPMAPRLIKLMARKEALLSELERVADTYEEKVWRELVKSAK